MVGGGVGHSQLVPLSALLVPLVAQEMLLWNSKKALLQYIITGHITPGMEYSHDQGSAY